MITVRLELDCMAPAGRGVPTVTVADGGEHCRTLDAFSCGRTFRHDGGRAGVLAIIASTSHTTSLEEQLGFSTFPPRHSLVFYVLTINDGLH